MGLVDYALNWLAGRRAAFKETTPVADEDKLIEYWQGLPHLVSADELDLEKPGTDVLLDTSVGEVGQDDLETHFVGWSGGLSILVASSGPFVGKDMARRAVMFYTPDNLRCWAETYDPVLALSVSTYLQNISKTPHRVTLGGRLVMKPYEMPEFDFQYIKMVGFKDHEEECILSTERKPRNARYKPKE